MQIKNSKKERAIWIDSSTARGLDLNSNDKVLINDEEVSLTYVDATKYPFTVPMIVLKAEAFFESLTLKHKIDSKYFYDSEETNIKRIVSSDVDNPLDKSLIEASKILDKKDFSAVKRLGIIIDRDKVKTKKEISIENKNIKSLEKEKSKLLQKRNELVSKIELISSQLDFENDNLSSAQLKMHSKNYKLVTQLKSLDCKLNDVYKQLGEDLPKDLEAKFNYEFEKKRILVKMLLSDYDNQIDSLAFNDIATKEKINFKILVQLEILSFEIYEIFQQVKELPSYLPVEVAKLLRTIKFKIEEIRNI